MQSLSVESLNIEKLKSAAKPEIFNRGQKIFQWGQVDIDSVAEKLATCYVRDDRTYQVQIEINGNYLLLKCNCAYAVRGLICEHDVAGMLAVHQYLSAHQAPRWRAQLNRVLDVAQTAPKRSTSTPYLLLFSLQASAYGVTSSYRLLPYYISFNVLSKELRAEASGLTGAELNEFLTQYPFLTAHLKSAQRNLNPNLCANCPLESVVLANILIERAQAYAFHYGSFPLADHLTLIGQHQSPLFLGSFTNPVERRLQVLTEPGEARLELSHGEDGMLHLRAKVGVAGQEVALRSGEVEVISAAPLVMRAGEFIFTLENETEAGVLTTLLQTPELVIGPKEEAEFLDKYYLPLAQHIVLSGEGVTWEVVDYDPVCRLYLNDAKGELQVQLRFGYGGYELAYDSNFPEQNVFRKPDSWTLARIHRRPEQEESAYKSLAANAYGLKRQPLAPQPGTFGLRARTHPVDFLLHSVPQLVQDGFEVYGEERLKSARVNRNTPTLSLNVNSGIDWFDVKVNVNFGEIEVSLKEIRRILRKKERYIKLADGTIGEIPEGWIERYRHLFALGEETKEGVRLSNHHLTLMDDLLSGADRARTDPEFERRRAHLRSFTGIHARELPAGFQGELRPYQKAGYDWLHFLHEFQFGGCLADDMGLGKTVQVLAFLHSIYQNGDSSHQPGEIGTDGSRPAASGRPAASLVVVPRSLLVNWQREAARFTPDLRILEYFEASRPKDVAAFDQTDVIITTYGILLRDIELLRKYRFHHVLLDESQVIKNPLTQTTKAARQLQADHRLVLTGTPVENSTLELWSQFAFLNPGLLGNFEWFKSEFGNPIEKKGDESAAEFLRKLVYPFILRRTKDQVAPELPPRSERILYSDMEPAQRKLYNRTRDFYRGMLLGMIEQEGLNNSRMKILEGLLRLRQICNHPRLVEEKFRGDSGKFELLLDTLETLAAEGHKALVFSQFVQMLRLVRAELDERKIPYAYLDGQTQNRQEQVDRFQSNPNLPFFLISLKAGGLGLNLTAADYVIHIDPWWNPAVEMQATDRTHRIGQDKPVFVYKLIARDSVEEKILVLQERKKQLVDQLITTESSFFKELTVADVEVLFG